MKNIILSIIRTQSKSVSFIKLVATLILINIYAITLFIFINANKIGKTHIELTVDFFTIIGYGAATIGVVFAFISLSSWRTEKRYEQKLNEFGELLESSYILRDSVKKIKGYLSVSKSGFRNPVVAYQLLSYETDVMCRAKVEVQKLISTKVHIDDEQFKNHINVVHGLFCQQQNIMYEIILELELYNKNNITIENVNSENNITKINTWLGILEKIHENSQQIEILSKSRIKGTL
ncbi:hypothetical protein VCRA2122O339_100135 [Vibrio crassostreae]|nr:hypothetical protein VCRA2120E331_100002 [Vibrio crassostreae]CAK3151844.1 hypothetical protein VCRA2127O345_100135 [Vibrio crassostreae]CAK3162111.1 hypothetical protein VCRA2120E330_110002 [Vibrio crassostreae]CAK3174263.1 hypothetical protein VCRA2122O338_100002 [Vibrio crassostreae]CAK3187080.1 hypothetical protein VCRA2122O339_100135 [Vibrio crassostreae]